MSLLKYVSIFTLTPSLAFAQQMGNPLCPDGTNAVWSGGGNFRCDKIPVDFKSISDQIPTGLFHYGSIIGGVLVALILLLILSKLKFFRLLGIVVVPNSSIGLITKKYAFHKRLSGGNIIATNGEAGNQAKLLYPGLYIGYFPWQFSITITDFIDIPEGHVGIVEAIAGEPIPPGHVLGKHVECNNFQDAIAFLNNGGQRGPQRSIIPPGTYPINTMLFDISVEESLTIPGGKVGIVTTNDGTPLSAGEIAGHRVEGHSSYQNADAFIEGGGKRGLQEEVMLAGTYYINKRFVSVQYVEMLDIPIGSVGVVVSFIGEKGIDLSGEAFTHGNLVENGKKGVWSKPLDPGRYPINTFVMRVEAVPTTNTVLNWITGYSEKHGLDANLESIVVRSKDGFSFPIEVSQIIHIAAGDAPKVIARFGTVKNLISQVLEPTIDNYFRNSAQDSEFLDFLSTRRERQTEAANYIKQQLSLLNVEAVDTLIGDIDPPPSLMATLTDRKVAHEQQITYQTQKEAQNQRQTFEQAKVEADTRGLVVSAQREAEIAKQQADAAVARARGEADAKLINAEADAKSKTINGNAEASRIKATGEAEASVLKLKVDSAGKENYALMNVISSLAEHGIKLVPDVSVSGGSEQANNGSMIQALMANLIAAKVKE